MQGWGAEGSSFRAVQGVFGKRGGGGGGWRLGFLGFKISDYRVLASRLGFRVGF